MYEHNPSAVYVCSESESALHEAHLRPAWVLGVIEIIVINAEERVDVKEG